MKRSLKHASTSLHVKMIPSILRPRREGGIIASCLYCLKTWYNKRSMNAACFVLAAAVTSGGFVCVVASAICVEGWLK